MRKLDLNVCHVGDNLAGLKLLPSNCVDVCVSSPPYYGLRDYGTATWIGGNLECDHAGMPFRTKENINKNTNSGGVDVKNKLAREPFKEICGKCGAFRIDDQIGLEATPEAFIKKLVLIYRQVKRVLKPSGTCWINIGDSYNSSAPGARDEIRWPKQAGGSHVPLSKKSLKSNFLKPKDLMGIPWMLAFALRADGWYLRQDIIWEKPNPMPESVSDRCTKSHEYIFLLSKSRKYYYDSEGIKEPANYDGRKDTKMKGSDKYKDHIVPGQTTQSIAARGHERWNLNEAGERVRNKRSVWKIATKPFAGAHFATFPEELPELCIKAGSSEYGCCDQCGAPWGRILKPSDRYAKVLGEGFHDHGDDLGKGMMNSRGINGQNKMRDAGIPGAEYITTGWKSSCECGVEKIKPSVVLDHFAGAGTTLMVAKKLGRDYIGYELNPEYIKIQEERFTKEFGLFNQPQTNG